MHLAIVHGGLSAGGSRHRIGVLHEAAKTARCSPGEPVDAVEAAIRILEDDPAFNAGIGVSLNIQSQAEADAGIVDGSRLRSAGVAALANTAHPISVAVALLRRGPEPVLLVGDGAEQFARASGIEEADVRTPERVEYLQSLIAQGRVDAAGDTVGCIAVGSSGLAAGASTGGITGKPVGRVGDAPLNGAGMYADDRVAVLCCGAGEVAIDLCIAARVGLLCESGLDAQKSVANALQLASTRENGDIGVILVDQANDLLAVGHTYDGFLVVAHGDRGEMEISPDSFVVQTERLSKRP